MIKYDLIRCMFRAVLSICVCTGRFVMMPVNLTCLHCLRHNNVFSLNISLIYEFKLRMRKTIVGHIRPYFQKGRLVINYKYTTITLQLH